jgi:hypothetical protein
MEVVFNRNWETGVYCAATFPDLLKIFPGPGSLGVLEGNIDLTTTEVWDLDCNNTSLQSIMGTYLLRGACVTTQIMCERGILPWIQFLFDLSFVWLIVRYIFKTWVNRDMI